MNLGIERQSDNDRTDEKDNERCGSVPAILAGKGGVT
jgi:hypothetical protein